MNFKTTLNMNENYIDDDLLFYDSEEQRQEFPKYKGPILLPTNREAAGKYALFSQEGILKFVQFAYPIFWVDGDKGFCWNSRGKFYPYLKWRDFLSDDGKKLTKVPPAFFPIVTEGEEIQKWDTWQSDLHCRFYSNGQVRDSRMLVWFQAKVNNPGQDSENWRIIPYEFLSQGFFDAIGLRIDQTEFEIGTPIEVVSDCFSNEYQIENFLCDFLYKVFKTSAEQFAFLSLLNNSFNTTEWLDTNNFKHRASLGMNTLNWKDAIYNTFSSMEFGIHDDKRIAKNSTTIYKDPTKDEIEKALKKLNWDVNAIPKFSNEKVPHMKLLRHLYSMNKDGIISITYKQAAIICFKVFHSKLNFNSLVKRAYEVFHDKKRRKKRHKQKSSTFP